MPVNHENYSQRGGGNLGIVLRCPNLVADRLVYFDYNIDRGSWVIRDFLTGRRLDNSHSDLTIPQIEEDATYDEYPPWCSVEREPDDWRTYLRLRSTTVFRLGGFRAMEAPSQRSGQWQPL